ncbi:MAG TPA: hypothetical protein P5277_01695 [Candidatus Paceibacterota bacterium]|nr:hypothetical protein [Candidatus Paceibacterota bacterium]
MKKRVFIFLEFLIWGVLFGIFEDFILIKLASNEYFTFNVLWIVLLVTIPFAFVGEYVVDKINFLKLFNLGKKYTSAEVFFEFLIFGVLLGIIEDLTAFYFAIGNQITFNVVLIATIVSIPFAFVGEFLIDGINFSKSFEIKRIVMKRK